MSGHVCRFPGFFHGRSVLQRGCQTKWVVAGIQHLHQPCGLRWSIPLSALPTSNIPSPLLLWKCACSFKGDQYHHHVSLLRPVWKWMETSTEAAMSFVLTGRWLLSFSSFTELGHTSPSHTKPSGLLGNRHAQACKEAVLTAGRIIAVGSFSSRNHLVLGMPDQGIS